MEVRKRAGSRRARGFRILLCAAGVLAAALPLVAGGTRPTPTPTPTRSPSSLSDLASTLRLNRSQSGKGSVTITNENLSTYARRGGITTAKGAQGTGAAPLGDVPGARPGARREMSEEQKKQYWRSQYQRQKQLVEDLKRRIRELNEEIPALWNQFYAWDDPAYRDGVIKPKIDKKLQEIEELKKRLPEEEKKLPKILEKARKDGALPGWFRDLVSP